MISYEKKDKRPEILLEEEKVTIRFQGCVSKLHMLW